MQIDIGQNETYSSPV